MAPEATNLGDLAAIAILADSSTSLFFQWGILFSQYIGPLFKRIGETNPGYTFRLGFITYGTSDTLPSPILCKNFFSESGLVVKAMRDDPQQLGLGATSAGGGRGMATLEGLVAAIEMFDTLINSYTPRNPSRPPVYHIIHLTSSHPDSSRRPQCNNLPALDNVTWETVPSELANRKIHLSSVVLNPKNKKIPELHSSPLLSKSPSSWLSLRPPHTAYLAAFNVSQKGLKRPGESTERSPDTKRLRTQPPGASPRIANANTPTQSPKSVAPAPPFPSTGAPNPPSMPLNVSAGLPTFPNLPGGPQEIFARFRAGEDAIKKLEVVIAQATQAGDTSRAELARAEHSKRLPQQMKMRLMISQYVQTLKARQAAQTHGQSQGQPQSQQGESGPPSSMAPGNDLNASTNQSQGSEASGSVLPNTNANISAPLKPDPSPNIAHANVSAIIPPTQSSAPSFTSAGPPGTSASEGQGNTNTNNAPSVYPNMGQNQPSQPDPQSQVRNVSNPSVGSGSPLNAMPQQGVLGLPQRMQMSPDVAAQMHKLIEQSERSGRQMGAGAPPSSMQNPNQNQSPALSSMSVNSNSKPNQGTSAPQSSNSMDLSVPMPSGTGMNTDVQPSQPTGPSVPPGKPQPIAVWNGTLLLRGDPKIGRPELKVFVAAHSANMSESRPETWPQQMMLSQSRDPAVPLYDFQQWAKRHRPVVCTFRPHGTSPDQRTNLVNETSFKALLALVIQSKTYIVSGWTLPSGKQTNNVLIAAIPTHGLIGAFFPVSGIPEMPKQTIAGLLMQNGVPVTQPMLSRIQSMPTQELQLQAVKAVITQVRSVGAGGNSAGGGGPVMMANPMAVGGNMGGGMGNIGGANGMNSSLQQGSVQGPQQNSGMPIMLGGMRPGVPGQQQPPDLMSTQFGAQGNMAGLLGSLGQGMGRPMGNMNMTPGQNMMTASLPRSVVGSAPSGGGGGPPGMSGNLSLEMLQSFMQRNAEGQGPG